jgi:hypothetical protein
MWLAAAFLMAMTSTLSAQVAGKGGMASPGSSAGSSGGISVGTVMSDSGRGASYLPAPPTGTCGTDTTKPFHFRADDRATHVIAQQLYALSVLPSHVALRMLAYRLWIQSTVDVLPPF